MPKRSRRLGFTLVELLVVLVILALTATFASLSFRPKPEAALRGNDLWALRQEEARHAAVLSQSLFAILPLGSGWAVFHCDPLAQQWIFWKKGLATRREDFQSIAFYPNGETTREIRPCEAFSG